MDTTDIWVTNSIHYIIENLLPENLCIRWLTKKSKNASLISNFGVNKNSTWLQKEENGERVQIDIEEDLYKFILNGTSLENL